MIQEVKQNNIIDGKLISQKILNDLRTELEHSQSHPTLAVILVGNDPASEIYVRMKEKAAKNVGITSRVMKLPSDVSQSSLEETIIKLNNDTEVDGILLQLPLPSGLNEERALELISPKKDVDGLTVNNFGRLFAGHRSFVPCTPQGIIELLKQSDVDIPGKHAVVIGRSNLVGRPIAHLLEEENATVTICHSKTRDIAKYTKDADILIVAVGKAGIIGKEHVKEGAVIIDVGINRVNGKLAGDVNFDEVAPIAGKITPVPGGVGPMTIAMLLKNTVHANKRDGNV